MFGVGFGCYEEFQASLRNGCIEIFNIKAIKGKIKIGRERIIDNQIMQILDMD